MFWLSRSRSEDSLPFVTEAGASHSFGAVFCAADELYRGCTRGIALILCERSLETVVAYCGALRSEIVPLLLDAETGSETVDRFIDDYEVDYVLSKTPPINKGFASSGTFQGLNLYVRVERSRSAMNESLALLLPTSGSTGDPKCVRLSAMNMACATESINRYLGMTSERVAISSLPFHYTYGLSVLNCALASRSRIVLSAKSWLDREFWTLVEVEKVTDLSGVPFMFEILRRVRLSPEILNQLECVNQAGGRLAPKLVGYFVNFFRDAGIEYLTMYGQTEASPRVSYVPAANAPTKVGSVGIPIDIGSFRTSADDGKSEGELIYQGPNVCLGYAFDRKCLSKGDENKGVLYTGDIAVIDDDGFATIVGRKKRFVKIYGMAVNLDAIESIAKEVCDNCAVIGCDDTVLILQADNQEELRAHVLARVTFAASALKCKSVAEITLNASGKVDYQTLMAQHLK